MRKRYRPLGSRILVRRKEPESKSLGGIIIPNVAQQKTTYGEVLAVGPGAYDPTTDRRVPMEVHKGDVVTFSAYAGVEIQGEDDLVLMNDTDVLAVIDP